MQPCELLCDGYFISEKEKNCYFDAVAVKSRSAISIDDILSSGDLTFVQYKFSITMDSSSFVSELQTNEFTCEDQVNQYNEILKNLQK